MHSCSKEKHQKPGKKKSGESRAWLFELFILIFSLLYSKHQPEEENVCFESTWYISEKGLRDVVIRSQEGFQKLNTTGMERPV